jgi:signal transduction histidine kinase/CheY-like chemotaxis protein
LIDALRNLSRIGVSDGMPEREVKGVVGLNMAIIVQFPVFLLSVLLIAVYLPATWVIFVVVTAHTICIGLTPLWRHWRMYLAARIWYGVVASFFFTLETALLGTASLFHLFLILSILTMFFRFPKDHRVWSYGLVGLYSICFVAAELLFRQGMLVSEIPSDYMAWQHHFNMAAVLQAILLNGALGWLMLSNAEERLAQDNEVIQEKSRQLEIANTYKSHFLASASHDLRQPLHALNLFVAQLQGEADPAERSRLVGRIDAAVGSMNELFEALLDMTKLEAGILKANAAEFPVARLLERVETTFADSARKKGLRLRVVASSAWVASDPILLERILLNLASNAVRYTEKGGVVVGCRRRGNGLRIDAYDTGAGIPEDQRQRIFGEFYQLSVNADRREGLGLGLAIVDRLGRLLGHKVELDSRPGRGSRFSVTVPLAVQPHSPAEAQAPSAVIADPARGKRIIVIDDDALVLDGMRGILQSWGCQVETAASGDAALASLVAKVEPPDLIISDSRLADGETGIEAIERLRAAVGAPIPAFVITGDTAPDRLREASTGGFHLLHKPVSPAALRATLNHLLRQQEPTSRQLKATTS